MQKVIFLHCFTVLSFFVGNAQDSYENEVSINFGLLDSATSLRTSFFIEVTNLTDKSVKILETPRIDYRYEGVKSIGNYIIELLKKTEQGYELFPPQADINPRVPKNIYRNILPGNIVLDSFTIGKEWRYGLPKGDYRIRIFFNWDENSQFLVRPSNWVNFTIE